MEAAKKLLLIDLPADVVQHIVVRLTLAHHIARAAPTCTVVSVAARNAIRARRKRFQPEAIRVAADAKALERDKRLGVELREAEPYEDGRHAARKTNVERAFELGYDLVEADEHLGEVAVELELGHHGLKSNRGLETIALLNLGLSRHSDAASPRVSRKRGTPQSCISCSAYDRRWTAPSSRVRFSFVYQCK